MREDVSQLGQGILGHPRGKVRQPVDDDDLRGRPIADVANVGRLIP